MRISMFILSLLVLLGATTQQRYSFAVYGDSIAKAWSINNSINYGINGKNTKNLEVGTPEKTVCGAILSIGVNDVGILSPHATATNIVTYANKLATKYSWVHVFSAPLAMRQDRLSYLLETNDIINKNRSEFAKNVVYIDLTSLYLNDDRTPNKEYFVKDGVHLSRKAYDELSHILRMVSQEHCKF